MMTAKERILAMLNRQPVDRMPVDLWHTPEVVEMLIKYFRVKDETAMWKALGLDKIVWNFMDYHNPHGSSRTTWGVPLKNVQAGMAHYEEFTEPPMANFTDIEEIDEYPYWPDVERFDYAGALTCAKNASQDFCVIGPWVSFYEIYCQLRGIEQAMMDLAIMPDFVDAALDRIEAVQTQMLHRFLSRAGDTLHLVFISDDIGGQNGIMMSPNSWRRHLQPRLRRWCELVHHYGYKVFYHSDGGFAPVMKELLDCGVDVLNPIQHVCPGMEMKALKRDFGQQVVFHGGVDNQHALPFGTVEEVVKETLLCLESLGAGREGYICCSCHNVQAGTPLENILAMVDTVHSW